MEQYGTFLKGHPVHFICLHVGIASAEHDFLNILIYSQLLGSGARSWKPPCFINVSAGELHTLGPL